MSITFINVYNIPFKLIFLCNSSIDIDDTNTIRPIYFVHHFFYSRYVSIWYIDAFGSYRPSLNSICRRKVDSVVDSDKGSDPVKKVPVYGQINGIYTDIRNNRWFKSIISF